MGGGLILDVGSNKKYFKDKKFIQRKIGFKFQAQI